MAVGDRVKHFREARGLSLSDLARQAEIARSYLYQVERNASSPTHEKLSALARALGVAVRDLTEEEGEEPNVPESLRLFADRKKLTPGEIRMLAQINYRGNQPSTPEAWEALYSVIQSLTKPPEG